MGAIERGGFASRHFSTRPSLSPVLRLYSRTLTFCAHPQAIVEQEPVFTNADNMFLSRPERYRHGLKKSARFTALKKALSLR